MLQNIEGKVRVLVTGATGFIGSHLIQTLLKKGYTVGIIKRETSDAWRIQTELYLLTVFNTDLADTDAVLDVVSKFKPNMVVHLAAKYVPEHNVIDIVPLIQTNVLGTINLLDACKASGVKLFINTSTAFVYGSTTQPAGETHSLNPINLYALTKAQGEEACTYYAKQGLKCVTFRLSPPYGDADNERKLIPTAIRSMIEHRELKLNSGLQEWDYTYIDDVVRAYMIALRSEENLRANSHTIFNVGAGVPVSVKQVISIIKNYLDCDTELNWGIVPHRKNEVWYTCADIGKIADVFNWQPEVSISDGLKKTVDYYKLKERRK